jgi:hypothetical protein
VTNKVVASPAIQQGFKILGSAEQAERIIPFLENIYGLDFVDDEAIDSLAFSEGMPRPPQAHDTETLGIVQRFGETMFPSFSLAVHSANYQEAIRLYLVWVCEVYGKQALEDTNASVADAVTALFEATVNAD